MFNDFSISGGAQRRPLDAVVRHDLIPRHAGKCVFCWQL